MPFAVHLARVIGAADAMLNAPLPGTVTEAACSAARVYRIGLAATASEFLFRQIPQTGGQRVSATGFAAHYDGACAAVDSTVGIKVESIHLFTQQ